jgi:hypothetical protein
MDKAVSLVAEIMSEQYAGLSVEAFCMKLIELLPGYGLMDAFVPLGVPKGDFAGIPEGALQEYFDFYARRCEEKRVAGRSRLMTPEWAMSYFSDRFAKVVFGGRCVVMDRDLSSGLRTYDRDTFFDMFTNISVRNSNRGAGAYMPACRYWFNYVELNEAVVFDPNPTYSTKAGEINLWKGFSFHPESNGKAEAFLLFVRDIICSGDLKVYAFLYALLAKIVQQPHSKLGEGIAVALRGKQGVGKNVFIDTFGALFGQAYTTVTDTAQLTRNFNSQLFNKIIVFGDEAVWGGEKRSRAVLKSMITSPTIVIERKYAEPFEAPNYIRLFTATNDDWAAPKEFGDRRWLVLDVSDAHRRDESYFAAIRESMENGGYCDLMHRLLTADISGVNFQRDMPSTEAGLINSISSLEPTEYFFYELLRDDHRRLYDSQELQVFDRDVPCDEIYRLYSAYVVEHQVKYPQRREELGKVLTKLFGSSVRRYQKRADGKMKYYYSFPELHKARDSFASNLGMDVDWDTLIGGGMLGVTVAPGKTEWNEIWSLQRILPQV